MLPPEFAAAKQTLLGQGLTNRAYCLELGYNRYFYREGITEPEQLYIDRQQERKVLAIAEAAGLIPEICYHSSDGQELVMAWCHEPAWSPVRFSSEQGIRQLAELTARIHALQVSLNELNLADYLQRFMDDLPVLPTEIRTRISSLQASLHQQPPFSSVLCHNDINPANLIGDKPYLIDWEYAAMGDPAFELAGICRAGLYNERQLLQLVDTYQQAGGECTVDRVRAMLPVADMIGLLWCEKIMQMKSDQRHDVLHQRLYLSVMESHNVES